ncbi:sensor histidine kinase [Mucilaginibacter paludis]|nr:histidine kinase [Mucilaginibacter paludis]
MIIKPWLYKTIPAIIWLLLLVLPFLSSPSNIPHDVHQIFLINIFISNILLLCIFYIHTYWAYPLFKNKGLVRYFLVLVALLAVYWLYWAFFSPAPPPHEAFRGHHFDKGGNRGPGGGPHSFMAVLSPLIAILCSFCYRVIIDNASREEMIRERETIHLRTELNFLRSQISPHFMFNVLNNLVALARKKSDALEPAIMNLSQLMRYMLYESDDNLVPLTREIEYLKNYIELQRLRFSDSVKVTMNINGDPGLITIEPMLLIPFVENAFKHGTGLLEEPVILISLDISDTAIQFRALNSVNLLDGSKDKGSGIGLANVQRRLAILYPEKHELRIFKRDSSFIIELTIQLS